MATSALLIRSYTNRCIKAVKIGLETKLVRTVRIYLDKKARRICLFSYQKACASKTISKHFATKVTDTIVFAATSQLPRFTSTVMKRLRKRSEEAVTLQQKLSEIAL